MAQIATGVLAISANGLNRFATKATAIVAVALVLALPGLGGALTSAGASAKASELKVVSIPGFSFEPQALKIRNGAKVKFTNSSGFLHTATDAGVFNTGDIESGRSVVVHFNHKGTYVYHCLIHPFMGGKIIVR